MQIANCSYSNSQNTRFHVKTKMFRHGLSPSRTRSTCVRFLFSFLQANYGRGGAIEIHDEVEKRKINFSIVEHEWNKFVCECIVTANGRMIVSIILAYESHVIFRILLLNLFVFLFASAALRSIHLVFSSFRLHIISATTIDWLLTYLYCWEAMYSRI